jgi:hypothetical protein
MRLKAFLCLCTLFLVTGSALAIAQSGQSERDLFLKYNYPETKDLAKSFLTLASAILVFSLTFSEKIVDFAHARPVSRYCLFVAWSSLILSIVLCGLAICFNSASGGYAVYGNTYFEKLAGIAYILLLFSGALFVLGLLALIASAWISIVRRPMSSDRD